MKTKQKIYSYESDWYLQQGYLDPAHLIDCQVDLNAPEHFINAFAAYNQHHIASGEKWDCWPNWELCLTAFDPAIWFYHDELDEDALSQMKGWLDLANLIHQHPSISLNGYTFSIKGAFGTTFSFDFSIDDQCWMKPGSMSAKLQAFELGTLPKHWLSTMAGIHHIQHSLGSYWTVPEHIEGIAGLQTCHTADEVFCFTPEHDNLPIALQSLILLCLDDTAIWVMKSEKDFYEQARAAWWNEHWPQGRPEDFECQYSKEEYQAIMQEWKNEAKMRIKKEMEGNE